MDKRTFLWLIAFCLVLFCVNLFFQHQNNQKREEWVAQQKAIQIQKEKKSNEDLAKRTAPLPNLPIVNLYADPNATQLINAGVKVGNGILTLSWTDHLPQHVFVKSDNSDQPQDFTLAFNQKGLGSPVFYQLKADSTIPAGLLPDFGRYDLQMLSFNVGDSQHPAGVTLGEYTDGHFSLPRNGLKDRKQDSQGHIIRFAAIALLNTPEGYFPVGFYDANQDKLVKLQDAEGLAKFVVIPPKSRAPKPTNQQVEEKFYVLENAYQQLVFSNVGGALAEINLPFKTKENDLSVVREIEIDREMMEHHPSNAYFPDHPFYRPASSGNSLDLHDKGQLGGYYPLLRRDLIQEAPRKSIRVKPQYYALNIVSEYPEMAELVYEVKHFDQQSITFEANQNHRRITKTFTLDKGTDSAPYCLNLDITVEGDSKGLWLTSGVPEVEWISGGPAPSLKYRITRNQKTEVEKIEIPKDALTVTSVYPDWICDSNGFLGLILDPLTEIDPGFRVQTISGTIVPSRLIEIDQDYDRFKPADLPGYMTLLPLKSQGGKMNFRLFAGPFSDEILNQVDKIYTDPATGENPDYISCQTMHGWFTFISEPFAKFLLVLLKFFHSWTGSWALSIVLLTIVLRIILYPLNAWSTKSMVRMQQISPEVNAIQERNKKDPKKAQVEIMNLYRERGVNPATGCLPLLIQMPFLIGMFDLLKSSFALRGAPFIPGWIDDLTAPDVLFSWGYRLPFIGNEFHLLPILLGIVMFVQQRYFSAAPTNPETMTDQQRQQKTMANMMSIVFAFMFYNFPSGLNIYWLSSMLLGILQQWYTAKQLKAKTVTTPAPVKPHSKKGK